MWAKVKKKLRIGFDKKWVGLHFWPFFHKLFWSHWFDVPMYTLTLSTYPATSPSVVKFYFMSGFDIHKLKHNSSQSQIKFSTAP
jgi:hypothetical protein